MLGIYSSLDFALIMYVTKIRQFHVSQFWHGTGPIFAVRGQSSLRIYSKKDRLPSDFLK